MTCLGLLAGPIKELSLLKLCTLLLYLAKSTTLRKAALRMSVTSLHNHSRIFSLDGAKGEVG